MIEVRTDFEGLTSDDLALQLTWIVYTIRQRLDTYVEAGPESQEAANEGLVLALRAVRVLEDAGRECRHRQRRLEEIGVYAVRKGVA